MIDIKRIKFIGISDLIIRIEDISTLLLKNERMLITTRQGINHSVDISHLGDKYDMMRRILGDIND